MKVYPPKTNGDLKTLHKTIAESTGADHHKISALYYILLDFDAFKGTTDISMAFERTSFLPQKYQIYMKGLWHMDQLQFVVSRPFENVIWRELKIFRMPFSI